MTRDVPAVTVWNFGTNQWRIVGDLPVYTYLDFDSRFNDAGTFQLTVPNDVKAGVILPNRMLTVDWRGRRVYTGVISAYEPGVEVDGTPVINVTGYDALSVLGWALAWRDPTKVLPNQPTLGSMPTPVLSPAETVIIKTVRDNFVTRLGYALTVPNSQGRGILAGFRPNFQNILDMATDRATRGGIGITVDLVADATLPDVRADLTLGVFVPVDRSVRVVFTESLGTLTQWSVTEAAPTGTSAVVALNQRLNDGTLNPNLFQRVFTNKSTNDEATWGGRREIYVKSNADNDNGGEVTDAGETALKDTDSTRTVTVTASETGGLQAFRDYKAGDIAKAELLSGFTVTDTITSIHVTVDASGPQVTTVFGDPDRHDPNLRLSKLVRALRRDVALLKRSI